MASLASYGHNQLTISTCERTLRNDGAMDSTNGISNSSTAQRVRVLFGILGALILFVLISSVTVLFGVGKWLVREDPLQQATAIVVLSGNLPTRALEAAVLYADVSAAPQPASAD